MRDEEIQQLLQSHFPDCEVAIGGDGRHVEVTIVGDVFEGLRSLKRQQLVYAALNEQIADGSVHAVMMKLFTRSEFAAQ